MLAVAVAVAGVDQVLAGGGWVVGWGRPDNIIVGWRVVEVKGTKLEVEVVGTQLVIAETKVVEVEILVVV